MSPTREQAAEIANLIRRLPADTAIDMCFINMLKHYHTGISDGIKRADDLISLSHGAAADLAWAREIYQQIGMKIQVSADAPTLSPDPEFVPAIAAQA